MVKCWRVVVLQELIATKNLVLGFVLFLVDFGADSADFALWAGEHPDVTHFHNCISKAAAEVGSWALSERLHNGWSGGILSELLVDLQDAMVVL